MKIAIDIRDAGKEKTGKGWYTFNIVKEILKQDKKNEYYLYSNTSKKPFETKGKHQFKYIKSKQHRWHFDVIKDLKSEKVDLFFAPTSYIIPAFAPKDIRVIITIHDLVAFLFPSTHNKKAVLIEKLTIKKALKKASDAFVVSENTKNDVLKKFDYPADRFHLTYCAPSNSYNQNVSEEELNEFKEKMKLPDKFLLAVGTIEPRKNLSTLIKSFVSIKKWHQDYKLVIVGKKGWKSYEIDKAIKDFDIKDEVIFPGYLKDQDLQKMYKLASVFVFPSLYEGFGIPPLEAMASGCPVVSSNTASLPEVIGEAGILIDPKNAYKMADAISSLLDNDHVRNTMIERGKTQVKKFSWKESAKIAIDVFNNSK